MKPIAYIKNNFTSKFGIPRQSGLIPDIISTIVFESEFQNPDALRGLEDFSHIWLIWEFSENKDKQWSPTVRPPRLGGNKRVGVFATRSPFRPNPVGLSCVKLESIEHTKQFGYVLKVSGADLKDGTPIYDIKPYIPLTDCIADATEGYTAKTKEYKLSNVVLGEFENIISPEISNDIIQILKSDPRPAYQNDEDRIYGFNYAGYEIKFKVVNKIAYIIDFNKDFT